MEPPKKKPRLSLQPVEYVVTKRFIADYKQNYYYKHLLSKHMCGEGDNYKHCVICGQETDYHAKPAIQHKTCKHFIHVQCLLFSKITARFRCPMCQVSIKHCTNKEDLTTYQYIAYNVAKKSFILQKNGKFVQFSKSSCDEQNLGISTRWINDYINLQDCAAKKEKHGHYVQKVIHCNNVVQHYRLKGNDAPTGCSKSTILSSTELTEVTKKFKRYIKHSITRNNTIKTKVLKRLQNDLQYITAEDAIFAFDKTSKRIKFFLGWTYIYKDKQGWQAQFGLPKGLYKNKIKIFREDEVNYSNWQARVKNPEIKKLLSKVVPLLDDWDLSKKEERDATMIQFLGYEKRNGLHAHNDMISGFTKSMAIVYFTKGTLHFGLLTGNKNTFGSYKVDVQPGDVIIVTKDSLYDIIFKHGVRARDVKHWRMSCVIRQVSNKYTTSK